jgi:hypothetical protein
MKLGAKSCGDKKDAKKIKKKDCALQIVLLMSLP